MNKEGDRTAKILYVWYILYVLSAREKQLGKSKFHGGNVQLELN